MEYGLASYEKGILSREEEINNQISNLSVYGVLHDRQGKLWIGSYGSGIFVFDKDNKCVIQLLSENGFFPAKDSFFIAGESIFHTYP